MKKSTFLGSVVSVLLAFSVISYAQTYIQQQDPKPVQPASQTANTPANTADLTKPGSASQPSDSKAALTEPASKTEPGVMPATETLVEKVVVPAESYTATAYSLRGRTASGKSVARGLIAADPRVLPLGTRVRVEAGAWSGEYVVADTGGLVKGRRIDIWTPTPGEAMRFGRRAVKLTVLEFGGKRAKNAAIRPRLVNPLTTSLARETPVTKQQR
jgi:3D (Asp-Asp-Asp) domain-containing protein